MRTPEGLLEPLRLTHITPTPPLLLGNTNSLGDYFKKMSLQPRDAGAADLGSSDVMKEGKGSKDGTAVATEKEVQPTETDDDDDDDELVFKMDMDG